MKSLWQIWTVFALCLAVVLAGMAWLSMRALDLDRAEVAARQRLATENRRVQMQQAETEQEKLQTQLEKNIGQALWRMDSFIIPLLAQESFLPYSVYEPFQKVPVQVAPNQVAANPPTDNSANDNQRQQSSQPASQAKPPTMQVRWVPSPLLVSRSPYVKLHFQYDAEGKLSSPQTPDASFAAACESNGIVPEQLTASKERLSEFEELNAFAKLAKSLPQESLPSQVPPQSLAYNLPQSFNAQEGNFPQGEQQSDSRQNSSANYKPIDRQMSGNRNRGDFAYRTTAKNQYEQAEWAKQQIGNAFNSDLQSKRAPSTIDATEPSVREGVSAPKWIGETLVLARRVEVRDAELIQGLEFDWPQLERDLLADVADLLPDARLEAVHQVDEANEGRMLATLPVKLVVPPLPALKTSADTFPIAGASSATAVSPIWATLGVAWSGVLLASLAVGGLLLGVVRLSERRAAFVSSVTHELRTPLTTFRMYAEMLAEDMITSDEQRQTYLQTLTSEADRLTHLVDNVLTYSRIERGRGDAKLSQTTLGAILDQCQPRLAARAAEAGMQLAVDRNAPHAEQTVATDVSVVEQILFNLIDNACKYARPADDLRIHITLAGNARSPQIIVRDHGPGLSHNAARRLFQPFSKSATEAAHSAPGVGLGLALSRRLARTLGGDLRWQAADGGGAEFTLNLAARG